MNGEASTHGDRKAAIIQHSGSSLDGRSMPIMLLHLGSRWFAMDVRAIVEVALKGAVTRVPTAPSHILGVTTLRGRLVTVFSLEQMIGGDGVVSRESMGTLPRLVVVREGALEMAVVAEGIYGMTDHVLSTEEAPRPPDLPAFVREVFDWQEHRVSLIDVPLLVASAARLSGILSPEEVA